jgi:GntR family transcriptional regulator
MAIVSIDTRDRTPIYAQLERALRAAIATGRLQAGDQLPTVRQLAVDLSVNANTVARVYAELEHAGVIETRRANTIAVCAPLRPGSWPKPMRPASPPTT